MSSLLFALVIVPGLIFGTVTAGIVVVNFYNRLARTRNKFLNPKNRKTWKQF